MRMQRTPPLSLKGSREVLEEISKPPADTPERRRTLERAKRWRPVDGRLDAWEYHPGPDDRFAPGELTARSLTRGDLTDLSGSVKDASARVADLSPNNDSPDSDD